MITSPESLVFNMKRGLLVYAESEKELADPDALLKAHTIEELDIVTEVLASVAWNAHIRYPKEIVLCWLQFTGRPVKCYLVHANLITQVEHLIVQQPNLVKNPTTLQ
jgi:hypothetical protein